MKKDDYIYSKCFYKNFTGYTLMSDELLKINKGCMVDSFDKEKYMEEIKRIIIENLRKPLTFQQ